MTTRIQGLRRAPEGAGLNRRFVLLSTGALLALPSACGGGQQVIAPERRLRLIAVLAAMVIPDTDTPGAGTAMIAQWVDTALMHGMRGGDPQTLGDLEAQLDAQSGSMKFRQLPPARQLAALRKLDDALEFVPSAAPAKSPWGMVKSLILRAYYTSEIGASKELRYEAVPGRFDASVAIKPGDRARSTDASARNNG